MTVEHPYGARTESSRFPLLPFEKIALDSGPGYLVKGLIPKRSMVVVWGPPKCAKTFFVSDLTMHIALGWDYRGHRVQGGPVVYCALEGAQGFKGRVEAFRRAKMGPQAEPPPFSLMASPLSLVADHRAFVAEVRAQLTSGDPAVVVIDTLNRSLAGSESDDKDMSAYVRAADAIRDAFNCAVIIVHHCGHNGDRPRGHSSLMGALDVQIAVKPGAADNIIATLELSKDGPTGLEIVSRLAPIEIGVDEDGDPITSCIIEAVDAPTESRPTKLKARMPKSAQTALRALQGALKECGSVPPASDHIPHGVKAVTIAQWRECAYRSGISASDEPRAQQKAFKGATEHLIAAQNVAVCDPFVWIEKTNP